MPIHAQSDERQPSQRKDFLEGIIRLYALFLIPSNSIITVHIFK